MKTHELIAISALLIFAAVANGKEADPKQSQKHRHPSGKVIVVTEGDYEPHSIGSYTLLLYNEIKVDEKDRSLDWLEYLDGCVRARDGSIENVLFADLDGDGKKDVVVTIRCAGSGNYLSVDGFLIKGEKLTLYRSIASLDKGADPVLALKKGTETK